ncbi:MAG TPA: NAD(P)-dependent oxidoreductase [Chitinophagaceae bacterium]|nr:NAD(P)-dependent oxidoreductase [Chitinophagaceae bacterium]
MREGKMPWDNRVAFAPSQCKWILRHFPEVTLQVQPSPHRCFSDQEYLDAGIPLQEDLSSCDILFGIKEVPIADLIPSKTYFIFSHTKKGQPYNRAMMKAFIDRKITLVDYECLVYEDGQRILGFGFFAGVVGAHNGLKAYGIRNGSFELPPVHRFRDFRDLVQVYFEIKLPPLRIVVTGFGRVASGCIEVMNLLGIKQVEPEDFKKKKFGYPVYTQLRGGDLFSRIADGKYERDQFHEHPDLYECRFGEFLYSTDILINGIYWERGMPRLFTLEDLKDPRFGIQTIADITCDEGGSVPCNLGSSTILDPVYGVDRFTLERKGPYQTSRTVDIMTVDNLPNELPLDASRYFGEQLIKEVLPEILKPKSRILEQATMVFKGRLTTDFEYLRDYAYTSS